MKGKGKAAQAAKRVRKLNLKKLDLTGNTVFGRFAAGRRGQRSRDAFYVGRIKDLIQDGDVVYHCVDAWPMPGAAGYVLSRGERIVAQVCENRF